MKKITILVLTLAITLAACAPARPTAPASDPASGPVKSPTTPPAKIPTAGPTATQQTSNIPLSESLLLVHYNSRTERNLIAAVDPTNGYDLASVEPLPIGLDYSCALSPDRKTLAVLDVTANYPKGGTLYLINLEDWSSRKIDVGLRDVGFTMDYAPDGRHIAIAGSEIYGSLFLVDTVQAKVVLEGKAGLPIQGLKFSADGASLMIYAVPRNPSNGANNGDPLVGLLKTGDFSWLWRSSLPTLRDGFYPKEGKTGDPYAPGNASTFSPGRTFARGSDVLYIANPVANELISVDFAARSVQTRTIHPELGWLEQLLDLTAGRAQAKAMDGNEKSAVLSADGRFLYISELRNEVTITEKGDPQFNRVMLGLQIVRTADAVETGKFETGTNDMALSPDGKFLYLRGWKNDADAGFPVTDVFDTAQGKIVASMPGFYLIPTRRLDGQPALVSGYSTDQGAQLAVFAGDNSRDPLYKWHASDYDSWLSLP